MANMIFQHTWQQVVSGAKTQTRRIVKPKPEGRMRIGEQYIYDELDSGFQYVDENDEVVETPKVVTVYYTHGGWLNGDVAVEPDFYERTKWEVGKRYAVMPARGVRGLRKVADIEITRIRREDIREISAEDVTAEGFRAEYPSGAYFGFIETWASMHDPAFKFWYEPRIVDYMWYTSQRQMNQGQSEVGGWEHLLAAIKSRPAAHYDAWVLDFRVVAVYADAIEIARQLLQEAA